MTSLDAGIVKGKKKSKKAQLDSAEVGDGGELRAKKQKKARVPKPEADPIIVDQGPAQEDADTATGGKKMKKRKQETPAEVHSDGSQIETKVEIAQEPAVPVAATFDGGKAKKAKKRKKLKQVTDTTEASELASPVADPKEEIDTTTEASKPASPAADPKEAVDATTETSKPASPAANPKEAIATRAKEARKAKKEKKGKKAKKAKQNEQAAAETEQLDQPVLPTAAEAEILSVEQLKGGYSKQKTLEDAAVDKPVEEEYIPLEPTPAIEVEPAQKVKKNKKEKRKVTIPEAPEVEPTVTREQEAGDQLVKDAKPNNSKKSKKRKKEPMSEQANDEDAQPKEAKKPKVNRGAQESKPETTAIDKAVQAGEAAAQMEVEMAEGTANGMVASPAATRKGTAAQAFQRVKAEEWLGKKGAWDNSYEATFGGGGWGAKAQSVLGQVRGKDFRHEKTKKKRGTYRGGVIDSGINSFKFESDDE